MTALVIAAVVLVTGCGGSGTGSARSRALERPDLQRALGELTRAQLSGAVALVETDSGIWRGASGYAEGKRRAKPGDRFGIASTTKTFVATVVLQLVGQGRLSLRDSVERWLPGRVREGRLITVRQLLNHTSGLPQDFASRLARRDLQQPLLFPPGTTYGYSNLNYVVLGLIVEKVTGRPLERVVRDRIFRPLSLWDSGYGTPAAVRPSARRTPGWLGAPEDASAPVNGADGIVSTTSDLARFFGALLRGELLERDLQSELTRTVEADAEFRAGLGLFRAELPCGAASGHGGDEPAYSNQVFASGDGSKIVVVAQNTSGWDRAKKTAEAMFCAGD